MPKDRARGNCGCGVKITRCFKTSNQNIACPPGMWCGVVWLGSRLLKLHFREHRVAYQIERYSLKVYSGQSWKPVKSRPLCSSIRFIQVHFPLIVLNIWTQHLGWNKRGHPVAYSSHSICPTVINVQNIHSFPGLYCNGILYVLP